MATDLHNTSTSGRAAAPGATPAQPGWKHSLTRLGVDTSSTRVLLLDLLSAFARFYMAYIWIKAGLSKVGEHLSVYQTIRAYEIFTDQWSHYLAHLIGPLEIAGGVLLLLGVFLRKSALVGTIVLVLFMIGISQAWARGLMIDCGCFNPDPSSDAQVANYVNTLLRDSFYIVLMMVIYFRPFRRFALAP